MQRGSVPARVGVRDLKARLSHYLRLVEEGVEVIVTVRGQARARFIGERHMRELPSSDVERMLADEGLLYVPTRERRRFSGRPSGRIRGPPLSETIRATRR